MIHKHTNRCFIALPVSPATLSVLTNTQKRLQKICPAIKLVKDSQLHLTLAFLGAITETQYTSAKKAMRSVVQEISAPFNFQLDCLGAFPSLVDPGIIWAGSKLKNEQLDYLARNLSYYLKAAGVPQDIRSFTAHVTLGRLANHANSNNALLSQALTTITIPNITERAHTLILFESKLLPTGSEYHILHQEYLGE